MFKKQDFDYSFESRKQHVKALRLLDLKLKRGEKVTIKEVSDKVHESSADKAKQLLEMVMSESDRDQRIKLHKVFELFLKKYNLKITQELADKIKTQAHREG